jgi:PleD family two-component response regulator
LLHAYQQRLNEARRRAALNRAERSKSATEAEQRVLRLEEQLAHQAVHDPLTSLPNRALFMDYLESALTRAGRQQASVAVVLLPRFCPK